MSQVFLRRGRGGGRAVVVDASTLWFFELGALEEDSEAKLAAPRDFQGALRASDRPIETLVAVRKGAGTVQLDFADGHRELVHWDPDALFAALQKAASHLRAVERRQPRVEAAGGVGCVSLAVFGVSALAAYGLDAVELPFGVVALSAGGLVGGAFALLALALTVRPPLETWLVPPNAGGDRHA